MIEQKVLLGVSLWRHGIYSRHVLQYGIKQVYIYISICFFVAAWLALKWQVPGGSYFGTGHITVPASGCEYVSSGKKLDEMDRGGTIANCN